MVGQSRPFFNFLWAKVQALFPKLEEVSAEEAYKKLNTYTQGQIRVNADELSYPFHILLRYEIERDLMNGELQAKDLPAVWNAKAAEYLGQSPVNDHEGCLQDIHWSLGAFGYFPSYTLGAIYAVQFFNAAKADVGDPAEKLVAGNCMHLLQWLRERIHKVGSQPETPEELCRRVTSTGIQVRQFTEYLKEKYD